MVIKVLIKLGRKMEEQNENSNNEMEHLGKHQYKLRS